MRSPSHPKAQISQNIFKPPMNTTRKHVPSNALTSSRLRRDVVTTLTRRHRYVIATTSSLFTFGFGVVVGTEEYTSIKLLGVGLCIGGTVLVALDDEEKGADDDTTRASLANSRCTLDVGKTTKTKSGFATVTTQSVCAHCVRGTPRREAAGSS